MLNTQKCQEWVKSVYNSFVEHKVPAGRKEVIAFVCVRAGDGPQPGEPELLDRLQRLVTHHFLCKVSKHTQTHIHTLSKSFWLMGRLEAVMMNLS